MLFRSVQIQSGGKLRFSLKKVHIQSEENSDSVWESPDSVWGFRFSLRFSVDSRFSLGKSVSVREDPVSVRGNSVEGEFSLGEVQFQSEIFSFSPGEFSLGKIESTELSVPV